MAITIKSEGRRHYLLGNTYPIKDKLRSCGAKWDPERKAWWTGKRDVALQIVGSAAVEPESSPSNEQTSREAPGEDATVAARATYKGKTYYVAGRAVRGRTQWDDSVDTVTTRDGEKTLLYFRDGSKSFWAERSQVQIVKSYRKPTTIAGLREYAEQRKAEDRGERECPVCARNCTCDRGFCHHHHDGCERCGAEH